jgi:hypothetical protein
MKKAPPFPVEPLSLHGGGGRDRTDDLRIANATLSQLSYTPMTRLPSDTVGRLRFPAVEKTNGQIQDPIPGVKPGMFRPRWAIDARQLGVS